MHSPGANLVALNKWSLFFIFFFPISGSMNFSRAIIVIRARALGVTVIIEAIKIITDYRWTRLYFISIKI